MASARYDVMHTIVRAPVDGSIVNRRLWQGGLAGPGDVQRHARFCKLAAQARQQAAH